MPDLMRCLYCGLLQDEPGGVKACSRCGGELAYETLPPPGSQGSYITAQMELDQVSAPAGRNCDRYLLVSLRTPAQVPPGHVAETSSGRPPLNFCAILDVSGSMQGEKIFQAKEAVRQSLRHLRDGDVFSLVIFSNDYRCVFEPAVVTPASLQVAESALREISAGGMTALDGGLALGLEKIVQMRQAANLALLLSDGQANVGETDLEKVGLRAFNARQSGCIVSSLGVGADYNEALMSEIASQGGGRFYHLEHASQIVAFLTGELGEVASLAARQAEIQLNLPAGATIMPLSRAYPARQGDGLAFVNLGDLPSDLELEIPLRLSLPAQSVGTRLSLEGALAYAAPAGARLRTPLNRVTLRFVEFASYHPRHGVVLPVAERVLEQIKAANVLGIARAAARSPQERASQAEAEIAALREYAEKLGEERARHEVAEMEASFNVMAASPMAAKAHVHISHRRQRGSKDFNK